MYISLKISQVTGLQYKLKSVYPITILKSIYNTLVLPHINYYILSWGSQSNKVKEAQYRQQYRLKSIEYTFCKNGQFEIF